MFGDQIKIHHKDRGFYALFATGFLVFLAGGIFGFVLHGDLPDPIIWFQITYVLAPFFMLGFLITMDPFVAPIFLTGLTLIIIGLVKHKRWWLTSIGVVVIGGLWGCFIFHGNVAIN